MIKLLRVNRLEQMYYLTEQGDRTIIETKGKSIVVNHPIDKMSQAWYFWYMGQKHVQDAFNFLTNGEREFLMTGITEDEWNAIFGEKED